MKQKLVVLLVSLGPALAAVAAGTALPEGAVRLTAEEIRLAFSDVRDQAQVQGGAGTTALNHWYADGSFSNRWSNGDRQGEVVGRWWVEDDRRCIVITAGLPGREGRQSCTPIYRLGEHYYSTNEDGSVHGIHQLAPLPAQP